MIRLRKFCCGFTLRSGTIFLIIVMMIIRLLPLGTFIWPSNEFLQSQIDSTYLVLEIMFMILITSVCGVALVGIFMQIPDLLAPFMVFNIIYVVSILVSITSTIVSRHAIFSEEVFLYLMYKLSLLERNKNESYNFMGNLGKMIIFIMFWIAWLCVWLYFAVTTYSYYCELLQQIKSKKKSSKMTTPLPSSALPTPTTTPKPTVRTTIKSKIVSHISPSSFVQCDLAACKHEEDPQLGRKTALETHVVIF